MEEEKEPNKCFLNCDCGCSAIEITAWDWEGKRVSENEVPEYIFSIWQPCFYSYQGSIFRLFLKKLKIIKDIIFKGEYFLYDLMVTKEEMLKFKDYINTVVKTED